MATLSTNAFSSYNLSQEEEESGTILTTLQRMVIQNSISTAATQKLNLVFDSEHPGEFGIQTAFFAGQIEILQYLLDSSEEVEKTVSQRAVIQAHSQSQD